MSAPKPKTSREDFAALVRRAGLPLTSAQEREIYGAYGYIEDMIARVRGPGSRPREAEPAVIFRAGDDTPRTTTLPLQRLSS